MKQNIKNLIISLAIPLFVGGLSALLSGSGMAQYSQLIQPPLAPPGWLFPVVWTALYLLMGYASYRIYTSEADPQQIKKALTFYALQLFVNFLWSPIFFGLEWRLVAFFLLLILWILILLMIRAFSAIDERAGDLLIPYLLWVTFAGYLNLSVYLLNKG